MQRNFFSAKWPALLLAGIAMAQAQTVTFTGSQQTLVSGTIDSGLAADAAGNIYFSSKSGLYDTVVKVSPDGTLKSDQQLERQSGDRRRPVGQCLCH